MGLDMYACTLREQPATPVDFKAEEVSELHYWRKHPNLHGWMEQLYREKGGTDHLRQPATDRRRRLRLHRQGARRARGGADRLLFLVVVTPPPKPDRSTPVRLVIGQTVPHRLPDHGTAKGAFPIPEMIVPS